MTGTTTQTATLLSSTATFTPVLLSIDTATSPPAPADVAQDQQPTGDPSLLLLLALMLIAQVHRRRRLA